MISLFGIFTSISFLAIFMSGINRDTVTLSIICSIPAICIGLIAVLKEKGKISIPTNFLTLAFFVVILQIYLFFVKDKINPFYYAEIFSVSLGYWLVFYNLKQGDRILRSLLIYLTLTYSLFYLATKVFEIDIVKISELYFIDGLASRHYHIGDLWAFALILIIGESWGNFNLKTWLLLDLGFLFLVLSNARSAYLSLIIGFIYFIAKKYGASHLKKVIPFVFIVIITLLFIFSSVSKTTIFSRPYFLQSLESFSKYPFGIGIGNFKQIGIEYYEKTGDASKFSLYTHDIFLEALSGVGIFSLIFLKFLYSSALDILREKKRNLVWGAIIIAILINFMFDTTYTIPGLIWILFMALGVFQSNEKSVGFS